MRPTTFLNPFPFSVVETADGALVGPNTRYPLALTKNEVFEAYWRASRLEVSANFAASYEYDGTATFLEWSLTQSLAGAYSENDEDRVEDAWSLGAESTGHEIDASGFQSVGPVTSGGGESVDGVISWAIDVRIFDSTTANPPNCYLYQGDYYPRLYVEAGVSVSVSEVIQETEHYGDGGTTASLKSFQGNGSLPGGLNASIFGQTVPIYGTGSALNDFNQGTLFGFFAAGSITWADPAITVAIKKWFGWDPQDGGGSVYDTGTGAELRDPFSVQS